MYATYDVKKKDTTPWDLVIDDIVSEDIDFFQHVSVTDESMPYEYWGDRGTQKSYGCELRDDVMVHVSGYFDENNDLSEIPKVLSFKVKTKVEDFNLVLKCIGWKYAISQKNVTAIYKLEGF